MHGSDSTRVREIECCTCHVSVTNTDERSKPIYSPGVATFSMKVTVKVTCLLTLVSNKMVSFVVKVRHLLILYLLRFKSYDQLKGYLPQTDMQT